MSRDAAFWRWYADTSDSLRHELVEKPWFGRETSPDITPEDMPGMGAEQPDPAEFGGTVWENETAAPEPQEPPQLEPEQ